MKHLTKERLFAFALIPVAVWLVMINSIFCSKKDTTYKIEIEHWEAKVGIKRTDIEGD